jgi:hypothetical protein
MTLKESIDEKLFIKSFQPSGGKHCQTTALKNILDFHGISISEEMLLGLGGMQK